MKLKQLLASGLSLALVLGVTGCSSNNKPAEETKTTPPMEQENVVVDNDYVQQYSRFYGDYMTGLNNYQMYLTPERVTEYYTTNEYPGNEKYLSDVKAAYKDSKEKVQSFVNSLKNDAKTEDADLKAMNDKLIAEGEKTIANIDTKLKKLDEIPKDAISKTQEEFIKVVHEGTVIKDDAKSEFSKMIDEMNKKLGINPDDLNNNNKK